MRQAVPVRRIWAWTAVLVATYVGVLAFGNTDRHRWLYLITSLSAWLVFGLVARAHLRRERPQVARPVLAVALVATVVQLPGMFVEPVASTDLNRYAWDGRVQLDGHSPYELVPFDDRLAHLRDPILFPGLRPDESSGYTTEPLPTDREELLEYAKNYPEQTVLSRPRFPTPYPPVAEAYYTAVSAVTPWSWGTKGFQLAGAALSVLTAALLARALRGRALDALLFAWCPTVVLEAGQGGHVDILVALFVVLAVAAARARRHPVLVGALMGLAAGIKLTPFTMLPAFTPWRRDGTGLLGAVGRSFVVGITAIGLVVLSYLPHYLAVGSKVTGSIGGYLIEENGENRASLLALLMPTEVASLVASAITLGIAAWVVLGRRDPDDPAFPALVLFSSLLFTTTPVLAWYCLPVLALATLTRRWEFFALGVAGVLAYGGHSYYPMTPIGYALALLVVLWATTRRWRAARTA